MCLVVDKFVTEPIITKSDVVCYKFLYRVRCDEPWYRRLFKSKYRYFSEFQKFEYVLNKKYIGDLILDNRNEVRVGFHSFQQIPEDDYVFMQRHFGYYLVECVIPAGSKLFIGKINDSNTYGFTSNQIIIKKEI